MKVSEWRTRKGEKGLALRNYERAIELESKRHSAVEALKKLRIESADKDAGITR